jgi:LacI family transcriptional regulator
MPRPAALATVKDVALLARVSPATVSRAFNAPELLDAKTLERVRGAARKLEYQPNGVARSLRSRRSMVVGAIIQSLENAGHIAGMVEMCQSLMAQKGYTMVLATSHFADDKAVEAAQAMLRQGIDSLMLVNGHRGTGVFSALREFGAPYVAVWTPISGEPSCGFDHLAAARDAAEHLAGLGHRRIAAVFPFERTQDRRRDRLRAIHDVLVSHGAPVSNCCVVDDCGFGVGDGRSAAATILEKAPHTTAVICANDNLAAGVILECRARGLRVPRDVSVIGYNDLEIAAAFDPAITTMSTPFEPIARATVRQLLARMAGEAPVFESPLRPELVVRASSGEAPPTRADRARSGAKSR